ncbi:MAG: hypothetical protein HC890_13425 [Chloroflexaceae bacterium]|nr:hypothetical protein [Chloroflexaceae bacterium]
MISLSAASILMLVNTYYLPRTAIANIHLGFILALIATITEPYLSLSYWVLLGAIATIGFYGFCDRKFKEILRPWP